MTAEDLKVLEWRRTCLERLGFTDEMAWELANSEADLGVARKIIEEGCPLPVAEEILR